MVNRLVGIGDVRLLLLSARSMSIFGSLYPFARFSHGT